MRIAIAALSTIVLVAAMSTRAAAEGLACDALAKQTLPNTTITSAQLVAAGQFTPPGANAAPPGNASPFANLPAFCRIAANCRNAAWQLGGWSRSLPRTR